MERCQCKSQHRKLMRENCGVRAAHSARDGARPQPLTLAFWPLPVPLRPAHVGMEHGSRGDCQMDRGTGMEWVYSGARGGFYGTLTSARNSRLPATVPAVVRRKRNAIGRARLPHHSPSAPLCASPCLLRSFSGAVSNTTSPSSRSTQPCATPQPLSSARRHVRTRLCCAFEPCRAFNQ